MTTPAKKSSRKIVNLESVLDGDDDWEIDPEEGIPKRKGQVQSGTKSTQDFHLNEGDICVPGQKLANANEYFEAGTGAHEFGSFIHASVVGQVSFEVIPEHELTVVSVKRNDGKQPFVAPTINSIVTCTVVSRTSNLARCLITHVEEGMLRHPMRGIIRREYITDKHRDSAEVQNSFGLGDSILARIVSIGEGDFILSTAEDGLGVTGARSEAGYKMIPVDWSTMECPVTKVRVPRKIAKVVQI